MEKYLEIVINKFFLFFIEKLKKKVKNRLEISINK
jgi:hypothetical protein